MIYKRLIENHLDKDDYVLYDGENRLSYVEIHDYVKMIVKRYKSQGVQKGERIVIINHNSLETVLAILACIAEGYVFVLIHEDTPREELEEIVRDCGACLIVENVRKEVYKGDFLWDRQVCGKDDICYILYTSGSSGKSKGIVACQKQVNFCIDAIMERLDYGQTDRILCCLPLSFDYGLYQLFFSLERGSKLFLAKGKYISKISVWLQLYKITIFPSMASMLNLLLESNFLKKEYLTFLRMITFTGEVLPVGLLKRLEQLRPDMELIPMYGLSECKRVSILPRNRQDKMWEGSCGFPLSHVNVFLKDKDEKTGVGELVVQGPNVMEGYWDDQEESHQVFGIVCSKGERFVNTGDLFRIDEEGFLYFCGRKSRLIKTKGYRFFPQKLEQQIAEIDGVIECRVIGIPHRLYGEQICICVYPNSQEILKDVMEIANCLPEYLHSYRIFPWNRPFPRNKNGKIDDKRMERIVVYDIPILGC